MLRYSEKKIEKTSGTNILPIFAGWSVEQESFLFVKTAVVYITDLNIFVGRCEPSYS